MDLFVKTTEKGGKYLKKADSVGFVQWIREEGEKEQALRHVSTKDTMSRGGEKKSGGLKKHLLGDYKRSSVSPASSCVKMKEC